MTDGSKTGGGGNTNTPNTGEMMSVNQQGQVMLTQQNMASLQHQQALQMQQQQQQQASMEGMQTSQAQTINQGQTLLVNTANIHQQLQNAGGTGAGGNAGGLGNQGGNQGGGTTNTMCLQQQAIQSSMASNQIHQPQQIGSISLQGTNVGNNQSGSTTITTMSTIPQQQQTAAPQQLQQVQVIQQPMQNAYVQQLYNAQGQMLMSALHPNMNPGSIQVIAAGKPFQSNQLTSHVLSKPVLAANTQQGSFPSYATIPTTSNQTLVITGGQLGVISGQLSQTQQKPPDLQKKTKLGCSSFQAGGGANSGVKQNAGSPSSNQQQVLQNCVASHPTMLHHLISPIQCTTYGSGQRGTVSTQAQPAQAVQIASPWQFPHIPQVWATATQPHHQQVIQNPIFIRSPQQDQPMFIQQSPPPTQSIQQQTQQQQGVAVSKQEMKTVSSSQVSRTLSILPSTSMAPPIRPASSASTQIVKSQQIKMKTKTILTKSNIPPQKLDAGNQTKPGIQTTAVTPQSPQHILPATKMFITSQGTIVQGPIDNKVVGQVNAAQPQPTTVAQTAVAMQQTASIAMPQNTAVLHQPQLIQPKPPPLMSLSMPSLDPLPAVKSEQQALESVPITLEVLPSSSPVTAPAPIVSMEQQQERLSEPMQQDETANLITPNLPQENGQIPMESKVPEPMEVVEPDPTPLSQQQPPPQVTPVPVQNGLTPARSVSASIVTNTPPPASVAVRPSTPSLVTNNMHTPQEQSTPVVQQQEESKEKKTPKAMVKPHSQVLTHIIEGYVIQESSEPFPINRTNLLSELSQTTKVDNQLDSSNEPPVKKQQMDASVKDDSDLNSDKLKCEICGKIDLKEKFKKKRFCSTTCARRGSTGGRKRSKSKDEEPKKEKEWVEGEMEVSGAVSGVDTNSETSSEPLSNPIKWTVAEVCDFIKNLPGCTDYAEDFAIQEIDGQALMLLKADHLMSAMSMKLGPALKICAKIDTMRSEAQANGQTTPV